MDYTRREFGKLALATVPAVALFDKTLAGLALAQAKPNSLINGVQIGTITYSYRSMPDQSAEAILKYVVDSGISAIELMGAPVEAYARAQTGFTGGNAGRGGGGGGGGARAGAAPDAAAGAAAAGGAAAARGAAPAAGGGGGARGEAIPADASWNGQPCPARGGGGGGGGARAGAAPDAAAAGAAAGAAAAAPRGGGGGGGRGAQTPEQQAAADELRKWHQGLSMDVFKKLRKMYNDAGVTIYAVKNLNVNATDEELDYEFAVAEALGANHITAELPGHSDTSTATLKRVGDWALKKKIYAAYHTHAQGNITVFDEAFAASKGNMANVDFGHYVAGGGGNPVLFLEKFHDRISSFHLKDRTTPQHCQLNLAWGTGETPIKEILQTVKKNKWKIPASIELEYAVPQGSDAVKEVIKCLQYCKDALA
jgi:sugar phosphate isomerase/epimerase